MVRAEPAALDAVVGQVEAGWVAARPVEVGLRVARRPATGNSGDDLEGLEAALGVGVGDAAQGDGAGIRG